MFKHENSSITQTVRQIRLIFFHKWTFSYQECLSLTFFCESAQGTPSFMSLFPLDSHFKTRIVYLCFSVGRLELWKEHNNIQVFVNSRSGKYRNFSLNDVKRKALIAPLKPCFCRRNIFLKQKNMDIYGKVLGVLKKPISIRKRLRHDARSSCTHWK